MLSLVKETLNAQIYQLLKKRLLEGYYALGERLVEVRLAEEFGVSRGPVREALKMLIQDELLVQKGNAINVFNPSLSDMIDIYQVRQQMESLAAKLSAQNIESSKLEMLENIVKETKTAWIKEDKNHVVELSIQFHEIILESSGNRQLISLTNMLRDKVTYFRNSSVKGGMRDDSRIEEHARILSALKERNGDKAAKEMQNHIEHDLLALVSLYKQNLL
ncbi:DNA-binding GntR family transcriptional regulator [Neobacillus niacini]|uniref:GntR family transcriptional regulator n=1 Tax=Neobacillus niacini TaxID=86668 RepID=UPI002788C1C2|nr:GntR family transcriptional regulator [Neobacillus niacini]MDQ1004922.1 DNA-binding GntR family transcriptional regulator [Neobacillus niacini]